MKKNDKLKAFIDGLSKDERETLVQMVTPRAAVVPMVEDKGRGYDIYSMLLKDRTIVLEGEVNSSMISVARAAMLYLNSVNKVDPIKIYIDSPGGSVVAGLALYDVMRTVEAPLEIIGNGIQMSMGSVLLAAGLGNEKNKCYMTPNSSLMIHGASSGTQGKVEDMHISMDFTDELEERLINIYVRHTGLKHEFWDQVLRADTFLTAHQAKEMGFVHGVLPPHPSKLTAHEEFTKRATRRRPVQELPKTKEKIIEALGDRNKTQMRPALVVALSKFPEYWTPVRAQMEKEREERLAAKAQGTNDNNPAARRAKRNTF